MLHIKLKEWHMQQHRSKYFAHRHNNRPLPHRPWFVVKRSEFNFFKHGHVAYQIKWNDACTNMVATTFTADPLPFLRLWGWGLKVKIQFFRIWSNCISNLRELHMQQHGSKYLAPTIGSVKRSKSTFSDHGHVAYQIKYNRDAAIW